jgi:hypothetical protein
MANDARFYTEMIRADRCGAWLISLSETFANAAGYLHEAAANCDSTSLQKAAAELAKHQALLDQKLLK